MSEQQQQQQAQLVDELRQKVVACQQQALAYKRSGDIPSAKQALLESKQWKVQLEAAMLVALPPGLPVDGQPQQQHDVEDTVVTTPSSITTPPPTDQDPPGQEPNKGEEDIMEDQFVDDTTDLAILSTTTAEDDDDDNEQEVFEEPTATNNTPTTYSLAEMMDVEMIQEFVVSGFPTPSLEEYLSHIETCKRSALEKKQQGKTAEALNHLKCMKQLQAVYKVLEEHYEQQQKRGGNGGIEEEDGETLEERALLQELMLCSNQGEEGDDNDGLFSPTNSAANVLEMDELIHMDLSEIQDAVEIGMQLPSLSSIQMQIDRHKANALQLKKDGDVEGAKHALQTFKQWSQQYKLVETVALQQQQQQQSALAESETLEEHDVREEDLVRLLEKDEGKPTAEKAAETAPAPPKKIKSSDEWKQEAIRLRDEKKIEEATQALIQYKLALTSEQEQRELLARQEQREKIRSEIDSAQIQYHRFIFWEKLVDTGTGTQQQDAWLRYMDLCRKVMEVIQTRGTKALSITTPGPPHPGGGSLRCLPDDLSELVYRATDPSEERLEVSMIDMIDLQTNKFLAAAEKSASSTGDCSGFQWVKFDVHVCIQLPSNDSETEKPVEVRFHSKPYQLSSFLNEGERKGLPEDHCSKHIRTELLATTTYSQQEFSHYVSFERGDSPFAKTLVRRMERRKITISVSCHSVDDPSDPTVGKRKGWFGGGKKKTEENPKEPIILGKVILDTKHFLQECPCIVGEYPLQGTGKREVGGRLRLCIRTGIPFGTTSRSAATLKPISLATLPLYPNMAFVLNNDSKEGTMGGSAEGSK
jgi:hypothetical protein